MTDADVDGAHIRTLLSDVPLPPSASAVIERGLRLCIAQPPLFKIQAGKTVE
ncbi:MAG: hypothetical protein MZU97_08720 [Bacillus subtilis]|nr:hypothetical protein [Bacillus subtilis]